MKMVYTPSEIYFGRVDLYIKYDVSLVDMSTLMVGLFSANIITVAYHNTGTSRFKNCYWFLMREMGSSAS